MKLPMPSLDLDASKKRKEKSSTPPPRETGSSVSQTTPDPRGSPPPEAGRKPLSKRSLRRIFAAAEELRTAIPPWEREREERRLARKKQAREQGEES